MTTRSVCSIACLVVSAATAGAADLTVELRGGGDITLVGAVRRWDDDGLPRRPVDPKAAIDAPVLDSRAERLGDGRWRFRKLEAGRYDLVVIGTDQTRVEGFSYPPIDEFDPEIAPTSEVPEPARAAIASLIARSRHYENRVEPLAFGGDAKQVRVLVQLIRDQATSFDADFGAPVATIRHEVWQFDRRVGGWEKARRTVVLDRVLMKRDDLARWTWLWAPALGHIEVGTSDATLSIDLEAAAPGLRPSR